MTLLCNDAQTQYNTIQYNTIPYHIQHVNDKGKIQIRLNSQKTFIQYLTPTDKLWGIYIQYYERKCCKIKLYLLHAEEEILKMKCICKGNYSRLTMYANIIIVNLTPDVSCKHPHVTMKTNKIKLAIYDANATLMALCKHWSYHSLALSHQHKVADKYTQ